MRLAKRKQPSLWLGFRSQINSTNVRIPSLLAESVLTNSIVISGFKKFKLDRVILFLLALYKKTFFGVIHNGYEWVHIMDTNEILGKRFNQILHLDDPLYSHEERAQIQAWYTRLTRRGRKGIVVVTFDGAEDYVKSIHPDIATCIIEQGYTKLEAKPEKNDRFSFVYSSPYIDYRGDKHEYHPSWSAIHLLEDIIPYVTNNCKDVQVHLIGRLGENARTYLNRFDDVVSHGLVSPIQNAFLLSKCHIALYPRTQDMKRRVLKISEYMGAEIPVVAYRLEDTRAVEEFGIGLLAENYEDFVSKIHLLYSSQPLRDAIIAKTVSAKRGKSWRELGIRMDEAIKSYS